MGGEEGKEKGWEVKLKRKGGKKGMKDRKKERKEKGWEVKLKREGEKKEMEEDRKKDT